MFEKEAEEYKDNTRIKDENTYIGFPNERISELQDFEGNYIDISERIIKAFKDGAEFGYNKANEWNKADVPTSPINKVVLGYIKHYNIKIFCLVGWNGKWWYDAGTYNDRVKLIAWKEIVLPELPKEVDNG